MIIFAFRQIFRAISADMKLYIFRFKSCKTVKTARVLQKLESEKTSKLINNIWFPWVFDEKLEYLKFY